MIERIVESRRSESGDSRSAVLSEGDAEAAAEGTEVAAVDDATVIEIESSRVRVKCCSEGPEVAAVDTVVLVRMGFLPAPCRVVYVVDEPHVKGFAYGTLPGHPESGEERFVVRIDPVTAAVFAEVSAFSRPATWWSKAGGPFTSLLQRVMNKRYVRAV